ncbi:hypothetical protein Q7M76_05590 (plasmid) [Candidatus Liberibacter asiaticus]|uniref:Uncharacterized protein n=2 Tax=Liberibacter asiaticus TaxID=34021 RepID=A0ABM5NGM8_LIBAS|nr:two-component system sensor histidine kinase AtoS [Candidatus Liberibacter asiaticus]ARB06741.1 hypothetical protein PJXGC_gp36 [Liberibacter phage P-JXGC-3]AGH17431.1 hypothetical protein WSI_05370 [Candidatus Liberibacter asiaticus str. gxpsy]ASK53294.1 hypothetical protein B2I23_05425 [Candidatus Liberibacter asiaticus]KAE9517061.1 hypothetical protein FXW24_05315 [Candidatus Liberibacter asiaticus]WCM57391.1 hypothetical protein NKF51_05335 [Candidatus Liberibacter asiaticus]
MFFLAPIRLFNYNTPMTNVAEKEKTHKTSSQPLTEYRLTLLEKNYDRLENKVDRLSDKMDARFDFLIDKMDKESKRVDARFEFLIDKMDKESKRVDARMERDFRLTFGALIALALGLATMMAKGFHWL